ncbi:acetyl-CoA hydrolase/transferase family protein [Papillibacter cinnamivorans]|uniref:4-hydroxybutyrate CoA-transferase n=1 Tax=Papillibacter cinnamivorans DSM 12816 TaxID=1122930 RepID=A0A1W1ZBD8_9FIRM|nr:acetyl-CoA hydrolase/transferase C-terminal domain-containing protein [Papillibacter cinnamivorans]SMC45744.1 4-hydroxybutyrate CoA-transferase [Papillibacter cinnamivorans DSM 12816]
MWKEEYKRKRVTADEAVMHIRHGDKVMAGDLVNSAKELLDAMARNKEHFRDVSIYQMDPKDEVKYAQPGMEPYFRAATTFAGKQTRDAVNGGTGDFIPCFFHMIPEIIRTEIKPDVALVLVSPPDKDGYCSYGTMASNLPAAVETARLVIAEVNDRMPYTFGTYLHISEIDYLVEVSRPIFEVPPPAIGEVEQAIGEICASLIEDGATIQVGIGAVPEATLHMLKGKRDLGVHTELLGDGIIDLIEAGVITNKKKTFNPGKCIATIYNGTQKLYDYVDHNPRFELRPVDYTNDVRIICQHDNLVSINACLQVDLLGQVNSETIGGKQFSGIGGQVDFVRGASMSRGGKSILAFSSTTAGGKISKIVSFLERGSVVTTSRTDVDYAVTEYGYAKLRGKSIRERAKALIAIAHPKFQAQLSEEFEKAFFKL